jgi:hypothetical protein
LIPLDAEDAMRALSRFAYSAERAADASPMQRGASAERDAG